MRMLALPHFRRLLALLPVLGLTVAAVLVNIVVNYALIFGNWGMPEMGIRGAAIASLAVQLVSAGALAVYAAVVTPEHTLFQRLWRPDWEAFSAVFRLGWPIGITNLAEVGLFVVMHHLLERFGARLVLIASLLAAALRWLLIGFFADSLVALLFSQLLHAATFGTFHAAGIHLVHHYFRGRHQGRGQALYASLSFGAGGAVGSLASGLTWEALGSTETYLIATGISLLGALVAWRFIDAAAIFSRMT